MQQTGRVPEIPALVPGARKCDGRRTSEDQVRRQSIPTNSIYTNIRQFNTHLILPIRLRARDDASLPEKKCLQAVHLLSYWSRNQIPPDRVINIGTNLGYEILQATIIRRCENTIPDIQ